MNGPSKTGHKKIIALALSSGCVLCGKSNRLHFHHRHPSEKIFDISNAHLKVSLDELRLELEKCVVLCSSCHGRIRGSNFPPDHILNPDLYLALQKEVK